MWKKFKGALFCSVQRHLSVKSSVPIWRCICATRKTEAAPPLIKRRIKAHLARFGMLHFYIKSFQLLKDSWQKWLVRSSQKSKKKKFKILPNHSLLLAAFITQHTTKKSSFYFSGGYDWILGIGDIVNEKSEIVTLQMMQNW